ncbi:hypothetical protein PQR68_33185 [Paraburkholderia agricolaris]
MHPLAPDRILLHDRCKVRRCGRRALRIYPRIRRVLPLFALKFASLYRLCVTLHRPPRRTCDQGDCNVVFHLDSRHWRGVGLRHHQCDVARGQR